MIALLSNWLSKSKQAWLAKQEAAWQAECRPQLEALHAHAQAKLGEVRQQGAVLDAKLKDAQQLQAHIEAQEAILQDRKVAVEKANDELKTQLRLLEAKASPDSVWVEAFSLGFSKAWDMMLPLMQSGQDRVIEKVKTDAIDRTLRDINPVRPQHELLTKQRELQLKLKSATTSDEIAKYTYYLDALKWSLNGHQLHSD